MPESSPSRPRPALALLLGSVNLVLLAVAFTALPFFWYIGPPAIVDIRGSPGWLVNSLLIVLFGLQHSLMARRTWKRWLSRWLPEQAERPLYVAAAAMALVLLLAVWQPMPGVVYTLPSPWLEAGWIVHGLCWCFFLYAAQAVDGLELLGVTHLVALYRGRPLRQPSLNDSGLYRYLRHPLMVAVLAILWIVPHVDWDRLFLNAGFTAYIFLGTLLEESDLRVIFGEKYRQYQARVPMFFPRF